MWTWFLVDEAGGFDKSRLLIAQFRALNLPAIRELLGIPFDETAAAKSVAIEGYGGVLLSPYDLYLHRNIGYAVVDYNMDIDDLIRRYEFPERCRVERRRSYGTWETRPRPNRTDDYWFWVRGPASEVWERKSFHDMEYISGRFGHKQRILVYVCD